MIKSDTETKLVCRTCGQDAIVREVFLVQNNLAHKVAYETHHESIIDPDHTAALLRAEGFYTKIFDLIEEFNTLSEENKIITIAGPAAAGRLVELDIGSQRPSACAVRTHIIPSFVLKTFGKEYEIKLLDRDLEGTTLDELFSEARPQIEGIISEARDRNVLGLS